MGSYSETHARTHARTRTIQNKIQAYKNERVPFAWEPQPTFKKTCTKQGQKQEQNENGKNTEEHSRADVPTLSTRWDFSSSGSFFVKIVAVISTKKLSSSVLLYALHTCAHTHVQKRNK
jgi:hypothetical protein